MCVCTVGQFMHRLYFLFARDLTPPLFRIECQLEGLTRYTMWSMLLSKEKKNKENESQSSKHRVIVARREKRLFARRALGKVSSQSQIERTREKETLRNLNPA